MALTPSNQGDVFIREVDDAYREDQLRGFIDRYGKLVLALAALIVVGYAAWAGYRYYRTQQAGVTGERFSQALSLAERNKIDAARKSLAAVAADNNGTYRAAAIVAQADLALMANHVKDAQARFGQVATDANAPEALRNLALVRDIAARFDAVPPEEVIARLSPIAKAGQPFAPSASELVGLAQMKLGKTAEAAAAFKAIAADADAPDTLKLRAGQMVNMLASGAKSAARSASAPASPVPADAASAPVKAAATTTQKGGEAR